MKQLRWNSIAFCARGRAFTLIELLVVIAIIGVLASILLPVLARAKKRGDLVTCISNIKQIGMGIQMYADDDEEGRLPGPCLGGAQPNYDKTQSRELAFFLAEYLGSPAPDTKMRLVRVMICPGYVKDAPGASAGVTGRKIYLLNWDVDPSAGMVRPFGYPVSPSGPEERPQKLAELDRFGSPASSWSLQDADKVSINIVPSWYDDLPERPVHGNVWPRGFFDCHVETVPAVEN